MCKKWHKSKEIKVSKRNNSPNRKRNNSPNRKRNKSSDRKGEKQSKYETVWIKKKSFLKSWCKIAIKKSKRLGWFLTHKNDFENQNCGTFDHYDKKELRPRSFFIFHMHQVGAGMSDKIDWF